MFSFEICDIHQNITRQGGCFRFFLSGLPKEATAEIVCKNTFFTEHLRATAFVLAVSRKKTFLFKGQEKFDDGLQKRLVKRISTIIQITKY